MSIFLHAIIHQDLPYLVEMIHLIFLINFALKSKFMHIMITNIFFLLLEERPHNYIISTVSIVPFISKRNTAYIRAKSGFTSRISKVSLDKNDFSLHKCEKGKDYTEMVWATRRLGQMISCQQGRQRNSNERWEFSSIHQTSLA